jgi:histidyl-tRNA synthetase (EC 6.1.1.21)
LTDLRLPRGLRDYSPEEYELLLEVRRAFEEEAALHGFRMMEPSSLELLSTLEAKSGPGIREEIYNFVDKGGREVGLRFDLTVGLTRYYCSDRSLPKDTRLAAFADVWRYDEPQRGGTGGSTSGTWRYSAPGPPWPTPRSSPSPTTS